MSAPASDLRAIVTCIGAATQVAAPSSFKKRRLDHRVRSWRGCSLSGKLSPTVVMMSLEDKARAQRASLVLAAMLLCSVGCGSRTGLNLDDGAELPTGGSGAGGSDPTPCPTHFADCDNTGTCETDLAASSESCGACGNVCPEGLVCGAGVCRPPEDIIQVAAGQYYTCALRASGEVLCWGLNSSGVLGDGTFEDHDFPVPVVGMTDAVEIDAGTGQLDWATTCARRASGTIGCWGSGVGGQLGNSAEEDQPEPVGVTGIVQAASVKTALAAACALLRDGAVWCWGTNSSGQLGVGTGDGPWTPAPVVNLEPAVQLDIAGLGCAAYGTGEVACWGVDYFGWAGAAPGGFSTRRQL